LQRKKQKVIFTLIYQKLKLKKFILKDKNAPDYTPKAMDFNSVTMNREMQVIKGKYFI
jgi:hypothetical protein